MTDRGRWRRTNEDAVRADPAREVYVVGDGLGGLPGGEVASRVAAETLVATIAPLPRGGGLEAGIRAAIDAADGAVRAAGMDDPRLAGMGTTVVLAVGAGAEWVIAHVGDSRAYLLRDGALHRMTTDHNVAAELVAAGRITEEEARVHRGQNVVTRTLGASTPSRPDLRRVERRPGDRLLLCTDGLTAVLDDGEIARVLGRFGGPAACCRELVTSANDHGGPDNITVLVADVLHGERPIRRSSNRSRPFSREPASRRPWRFSRRQRRHVPGSPSSFCSTPPIEFGGTAKVRSGPKPGKRLSIEASTVRSWRRRSSDADTSPT